MVQKNHQTHKNYEIVWHGESEINLPNGSKLIFKKVKGKGIALDFLKEKNLSISNRKGGESFKPDSKRPTKKVKQLLQESNLPPWERESLPLIFLRESLVCIPGFGVDSKYQTRTSKIGLEVVWKA